MGSYPVNAEGAGDPRNEEHEEEYQSQNRAEGGPEPIGARIVAIPSQAGTVSVIPRPAEDQQPDVAPPDPMRMVDVQRQQEEMAKLADLVKPSATTPAGNANRAGSGATAVQGAMNAPAGAAADAAKRPGNQAAGAKPAASAPAGGPPKPGTSGTAERGVQGNGSQGKGATTGTEQQNSGGQNVQAGRSGWIEKGKDFVGQVEKGVKDAEDNVFSWFHRLMATKDEDAKKTGSAAGNGGQGTAQPEELPTIIDGNHGKQSKKESQRKPAATVASSDGGNNIYKPPKGQKVQDLVDEGVMLNEKKQDAQCVRLVKGVVGAPPTKDWRPGQRVTKGASIPPGTVIATFDGDHYPTGTLSRPKGHIGRYSDRHAAIYLGQTEKGIWVVDQDDAGKAVHTTLIPWDRPEKGRGNNGSEFSVIEWGTPKGKTAGQR